jgi:SpoIID/LytB domain protein
LPADGGVVGVPARGRSYRGAIEASGDGGALRLINQVDVETYLVGMGEVRDPSWPLASLEAQEVAARTYAMRAMATGGELCDDTRCQVYLGADAEYPAAQRAVAATAGEVMVSKGGLVDAVYSANAAGYSASRQEGFGVTDTGYPYLRAAPYPTKDPMPWTVQIATKDVVTRLGLHGDLTNVAVAGKGPSGRALEVTVTAGSTTQVVSGLAFAAALGLRSTMIDAIRAEIAAVAPPPPGASVIQVPPEDAAGVAAAIIPEVEIQALNGDVVQNAAMPDFGAGRLPIAHQADVPVGRVVLAIGLVALTGAGVFRSRPSRRRAYPRRRPSPPAYRR